MRRIYYGQSSSGAGAGGNCAGSRVALLFSKSSGAVTALDGGPQ